MFGVREVNRPWPVVVVLAAAVSLVLGVLLPVAAAPDAGAAQPAAAPQAAQEPRVEAAAADYASMVMVSSSGENTRTFVPAAAQEKCAADKKATKKKVKKSQTKKIYKKSLKKAKKKAKKQGKKVTKKQKKKLKKKAEKKAAKKAKKQAKKVYDKCMADARVVEMSNTDFLLTSSAAAGAPTKKVALGDGSALTALGASPVARFSGEASDGTKFDMPVTLEDIKVADGKLSMRTPVQPGAVSANVKSRSDLADWAPGAAAAIAWEKPDTWKNVSVVAQPAATDTYRWSGVGAGQVSRSGNTVTATLTGSAAAAGDRKGSAGQMAWADLAKNYQAMAAGPVKPRLAVWGAGGAGTKGAILAATDVTLSGGALTVKGDLSDAGDAASVLPDGAQATMSVVLETGSIGRTTEYVVVTGDSIASGEGGRFRGSYWLPAFLSNKDGTGTPPLPTEDEKRERVRNFCDQIDLACTGAKPDADGKMVYTADPGKVYEKGTWENADVAACHRSKYAPGTWLARWRAEQGRDVESINIACSGAQTKNILTDSFKGEQPQAQQLEGIADWLPVTHIVNTIGANDIGFADVATDCILAPINVVAGDVLGAVGGNLDQTELLRIAGRVLPKILDDAEWVDGKPVSMNPWFSTDSLCRPKEEAKLADRLAKVGASVKAAVEALHKAAPRALLVQTNYPAVIAPSNKTVWPKEEYWRTTRYGGPYGGPNYKTLQQRLQECDGTPSAPATCNAPVPGLAEWVNYLEQIKTQVDPKYVPKDWPPPGKPNPDPVKGALEDNPWNATIMTYAYALNILPGDDVPSPDGTWTVWEGGSARLKDWMTLLLFELQPLLDVLAAPGIMFGIDQEWAITEVLPTLNRDVAQAIKDADPDGSWSVMVDMTQVFNGRELGSKFGGKTKNPAVAAWNGTKCEQAGSVPGVCKPGTGPGSEEGVAGARAQLVNHVASGQELPFLCPGPDEVAGAAGPKCFGDKQDALHPNFRGQAAEGQCIIAVVEGLLGGGNACVRTVGGDQGAQERLTGFDGSGPLDIVPNPEGRTIPAYGFEDFADFLKWSKADGDDRLCLISAAESTDTMTKSQYTRCNMDFTLGADPTWSKEFRDLTLVEFTPSGGKPTIQQRWR